MATVYKYEFFKRQIRDDPDIISEIKILILGYINYCEENNLDVTEIFKLIPNLFNKKEV